MAWALSMGTIRSTESEFERASSGPTSLRHPVTGSKRTRQTRVRPGRQTGCRTSHEFADRGNRQIEKVTSWSRAKPKNSGMDGVNFSPISDIQSRPDISGLVARINPCPFKAVGFSSSHQRGLWQGDEVLISHLYFARSEGERAKARAI